MQVINNEEDSYIVFNSIKQGLRLSSLVFRPNLINLAYIYYTNGFLLINVILFILIMFSSISTYILSETVYKTENNDYATLFANSRFTANNDETDAFITPPSEQNKDNDEDINVDENDEDINVDENDEDINVDENDEDINVDENDEDINVDENDEDINVDENDEDINVDENDEDINVDENDEDINVDENDEDINVDENDEDINVDENDEDINVDENESLDVEDNEENKNVDENESLYEDKNISFDEDKNISFDENNNVDNNEITSGQENFQSQNDINVEEENTPNVSSDLTTNIIKLNSGELASESNSKMVRIRYKMIIFCIFSLRLTRAVFTINHFMSIIFNFEFLKKYSGEFITFLIITILYLLFPFYKKITIFLPLLSGLTALFFTFTSSGILSIDKPEKKTSYIYNNIGVIMLWLSSHPSLVNFFPINNSKKSRILTSSFSSIVTFFFYFCIGTFGFTAYPQTESIWINNLDHPENNPFTLIFLIVNFLRLPGVFINIIKDIKIIFSRYSNNNNDNSNENTITNTRISKFINAIITIIFILCVVYCTKTISNLLLIRLWCLMIGSLIAFVIPPLIAIRNPTDLVSDKLLVYSTLIFGLVLIALSIEQMVVRFLNSQ